MGLEVAGLQALVTAHRLGAIMEGKTCGWGHMNRLSPSAPVSLTPERAHRARDVVLGGIIVRGSIVGTRLDLQESLVFADQGKVKATVTTDKLENINHVFSRMREGDIGDRVVLDFAA